MILKDVLQTTIDKSHEAANAPAAIVSHIDNLDEIVEGIRPGNLIVLAGEPGSGKTALGVQWAINVAKYDNKVVAIFSLEMSVDELGIRILANQASVDSKRLRDGLATEVEWRDKIYPARDQLQDLNVEIYDKAGVSPAQILQQCEQIKAEIGLDMIVVDHIQIMNSDQRWAEKRLQVSEITMKLKRMAKYLNVPVIACSQLSRKRAERKSRRPQMTDLKESSSIEQDADVVLFVYTDAEKAYVKHIYTAKNRNAEPYREQHLIFDGAYMRFADWSQDAEQFIERRGYFDKTGEEMAAAEARRKEEKEQYEEVGGHNEEDHYEQITIGKDYEDEEDDCDIDIPF